MEECALCGKQARTYCESDQAKLCWDCDNKVHGANFLVAKHTRVLLCRTCQSSTPWKASGPKLTPTHSLCLHCATTTNSHTEEEDQDRDDRRDFDHDDGDSRSDSDSDSDLGSDGDDDDDDEEEEEGENQVVPWSSAHASSSFASSSLASKRMRGDSFVDSDEERDGSSSEIPSATTQLADDDSSSWSNFRPWKQPRTHLVEDAARLAET